MHCSKCGKENPDNAQVCGSCSSVLTSTPTHAPAVSVKTSRMAIAALVLGILSIFTLGLTTIPALIFGIISFVIIERSGGRITGRGFAIAGIVVPVVGSLPLWILTVRIRQTAFRMVCETNLSDISRGMSMYSHDYDNEYPRAGGIDSVWATGIANWKADNRITAFGLSADGSGGMATITSSLYLLVKYTDRSPRSFVCKGDSGTTKFRSEDYNVSNMWYMDLWDFGPESAKHCSYSYHIPYGLYPLTSSSEPGMAVVADRNPWMKSPRTEGKDASLLASYNPLGGKEKVNIGNAISHQEEGQNVLFVDGHVAFKKQPFCGINNDNIYTYWDGVDVRRGGYPIANISEPSDKLDSFLVNDGEGGSPPVGVSNIKGVLKGRESVFKTRPEEMTAAKERIKSFKKYPVKGFRRSTASGPTPADGAIHEDTWVSLSWTYGESAVSFDVYFGENMDDVATGAESTFQGNHKATFFVVGFPGFPYPDGLVPETTYYWRIDEVNEAEPNSPRKGDVWSFSIPPKTAHFPDSADGVESEDEVKKAEKNSP